MCLLFSLNKQYLFHKWDTIFNFTTVDFSIVINLPDNFLNLDGPLDKYRI